MSSETHPHVVLTHVEVIGDLEAFADAWRAWIGTHVQDSPGLLESTLHREQTGRRMLWIQRWATPSAYDAWHATDAAASSAALFREHAVRSASSHWHELGRRHELGEP